MYQIQCKKNCTTQSPTGTGMLYIYYQGSYKRYVIYYDSFLWCDLPVFYMRNLGKVYYSSRLLSIGIDSIITFHHRCFPVYEITQVPVVVVTTYPQTFMNTCKCIGYTRFKILYPKILFGGRYSVLQFFSCKFFQGYCFFYKMLHIICETRTVFSDLYKLIRLPGFSVTHLSMEDHILWKVHTMIKNHFKVFIKQ